MYRTIGKNPCKINHGLGPHPLGSEETVEELVCHAGEDPLPVMPSFFLGNHPELCHYNKGSSQYLKNLIEPIPDVIKRQSNPAKYTDKNENKIFRI